MKKSAFWTGLAVLMVALDQITKVLASAFLKGNGTKTIIPYLIDFYYTTNDGAAFSSFSGQRVLLIALPIVMIIALLIALYKFNKKGILFTLSIIMIVSGGIGNLIDRCIFGYVVDFISFSFMNFPIFNVADIFVTVGAALFIVYIIFFDDNKKSDVSDKDE